MRIDDLDPPEHVQTEFRDLWRAACEFLERNGTLEVWEPASATEPENVAEGAA